MNENDAIRKSVLESVENLPQSKLNAVPEGGGWSIMQILEHLYLMERSITKSFAVSLAGNEKKEVSLKPIEMTTDRSTRVDAPPFVIPEDSDISLDEMKKKLEQSRMDFIKVTGTASEDDLNLKSFRHPLFGDLSLKQWVPFVGLHEKRHLQQIEETKARI
ncbi:DinB family protein [Actinomycetes bacterium NPDC127524]